MPSLSVSGTGHPSYLATPATVGHLSLLSNTPSPSVSLSTGGGTTDGLWPWFWFAES